MTPAQIKESARLLERLETLNKLKRFASVPSGEFTFAGRDTHRADFTVLPIEPRAVREVIVTIEITLRTQLKALGVEPDL